MKNTIKFLGIIALVAVIGFSMAACSDDDDDGGGGDDSKKITFGVAPSQVTEYTESVDITIPLYPTSDATNIKNAFKALTADDIVFTPNDVVTRTGFEQRVFMDEPFIRIEITKQKSGTVRVSIKNKDGYSFVHTTNVGGGRSDTFIVE